MNSISKKTAIFDLGEEIQYTFNQILLFRRKSIFRVVVKTDKVVILSISNHGVPLFRKQEFSVKGTPFRIFRKEIYPLLLSP